MPEQEFLEWIVGQTGLAAVALVAMWLLRDQVNCRVLEAKENKEQLKSLLATVIEVVKANTSSFTEQATIMRDLKDIIKELKNLP